MIEATPTANARLPFRAGDFTSLAEGLDYAALGDTGVNFFSSRGSLERAMPYRELREEALALARRLTATQLVRGDRIGVIAETSRDFLAVFFACQYAGFVPVPLPLSINFGGKDAYVERLRGMLEGSWRPRRGGRPGADRHPARGRRRHCGRARGHRRRAGDAGP